MKLDPTLFMKEKPVRALIVAYKEQGTYASEISKEVDTTYAHTIKIVKEFEKIGLLKREKEGRKKVITPTDEGKEIAKGFSYIWNMIDPDRRNFTDAPFQKF